MSWKRHADEMDAGAHADRAAAEALRPAKPCKLCTGDDQPGHPALAYAGAQHGRYHWYCVTGWRWGVTGDPQTIMISLQFRDHSSRPFSVLASLCRRWPAGLYETILEDIKHGT